jgi:hypothetical protein
MKVDEWIRNRQEDAKKKEQASEAAFQHSPQKWQEVKSCAAKLNNQTAGLDWPAQFSFRAPSALVLDGHGARFESELVGTRDGGHKHEYSIVFFRQRTADRYQAIPEFDDGIFDAEHLLWAADKLPGLLPRNADELVIAVAEELIKRELARVASERRAEEQD